MKNLLILSVLLMSLTSFGQMNSLVYLKNGNQIKGEILKNDATGVQIRTRDGSVWNYTIDEVASTEKFTPTVSGKGFYNRSSIGVMGGDQVSPSLQVVNGYAFNPHWEAGFGIGLESFYWRGYMPLFLEGRYNLLKSRISPFVSMNAGYVMPLSNFVSNKGGFTAGAQVGITHFITNHIGISTSAGYRFAYLQTNNMWWDDFQTIQQINRFEVRLGLIFR